MRAKPDGSYISYFSDLVKINGGINLAQGIPGFQPPAELIRVLKDVADTQHHQYAPGIGNLQLRTQIERRYGVEPDGLLVVQGATEGLSLVYTYLFRMLGNNLVTLSFDPAYESYSRLPQIFNHKFIAFPLLNDEIIDFNELRKSIEFNRVKLIFLSSPGNPYGKVWTSTEVSQLLELATELNFFVVFDSVYEEFYFSQKPYIPLDNISERLFIVSSFSKSLCITGWRVGYVIHHPNHTKAIRAIHDYIGLCAPSVTQQALAVYLAQFQYGNTYMEELRQWIKNTFNSLRDELIRFNFTVPRIDGGCFIWAKLPDSFTDGFEFASDLYETTGVAVIPGEHFSSSKINWLRFNVARPIEEIDLARKRIADFMSKL
ncbi:MAG TPA: pyridoxal phosphate-dependent aminotransferase [Bacteroidales bacterium]|nr:pyridoxal phosphate-dependent aminotransferase [Bacteroidales bacterium]